MLGLFIIVAMAVVIISIVILNKRDKRIENEKCQKRWEKYITTKYNALLKENGLVMPGHRITIKYAIDWKDVYVWKTINTICIMTSLDYLKKDLPEYDIESLNESIKNEKLDIFVKQIKIEDIFYYKVEGDVITSTYTTGGTVKGGGSSLTGAIVGGVLAGDVGAIIGSREKIEVEPVSTHTEHDDQRVVSVYISEGDTVKIQQYPYKLYGAFQKLIPEKSYDYIALHQTTQPKEKSSADRLQELQALKDSGLITEDEYHDKRMAIVSEI